MHLNSTIWRESPKSFHSFLGNNVEDITMDNPQIRLSEIDLAWLAGMWEADGSFSLNKCNLGNGYTQYQVNMQYVNTDIELVIAVIEVLKKMQVGYYQLSRINTTQFPNAQMKHELRIQGMKRGYTFLTQILPYLRGKKKRRAELILEFVNERLSKNKTTPYGDVELDIFARYLTEISTTNMSNTDSVKIESDLQGNLQSGSHEANHPLN